VKVVRRALIGLVVSAALSCGPSGPAVYCTPDETMCHGSCSALYKDPINCGGCDVACGSGLVCSQGKCATSCAGGTVQCGQSCVETEIDRLNCGQCGRTCAQGEVCSKGTCSTTCASGQIWCAVSGVPYCANWKSDNLNCGACGVACGVEEVCSGGLCLSECAPLQFRCPDQCADLQTDPLHCGNCKTACALNGACVHGNCTCPAGMSECAPSCVDLQTDKTNCGACNQACLYGTCSGGRCTSTLTNVSYAIATLDVTSKVFFGSGPTLWEMATNGANLSQVEAVTTNVLTVDGSYVYWGYSSEVGIVPIGGGTSSYQAISSPPASLVSDSSYVYVAEATDVVSFPSGGGTATTTLAPAENAPHGLATYDGVLYWATDDYQIRTVHNDGTSLATLVTMDSVIGDVATDGTNVYFAWSNDLVAIPTNAASSVPLLLVSLATPANHITTDGTSVYWSDPWGIHKVPVGGGAVDTLVSSSGGNLLVVDSTAVYFTTSTSLMKVAPK
jgi:hypothetical protein